MIVGVDHAQITIPKGKEGIAREFYCNLLGLSETEKPENRKQNGGFWLQLNNFQVHVGTEDGFDRLTTKGHLACVVDDLDQWRIKLVELNYELKESAPFPHAKSFELRDPFGNRLELIQYI